MRILKLLPLFLASGLLAACGSDPAPPESVRADNNATPGAGGAAGAAGQGNNAGTTQGQGGGNVVDPGGKGNNAEYPAGPYGLELGNVIQNFKFSGLRAPLASGYDTSAAEPIALSDFYNPSADPSKPRALVVTAAARWCVPCQEEAKASMGYYKYWNPKGAQFLTAIIENTNHEPSEYTDLNLWTSKYKLEYPVVLDPSPPQLGVFFDVSAIPFNMVVDLTTMKILFKVEGGVDFGPDNATLKKALGG